MTFQEAVEALVAEGVPRGEAVEALRSAGGQLRSLAPDSTHWEEVVADLLEKRFQEEGRTPPTAATQTPQPVDGAPLTDQTWIEGKAEEALANPDQNPLENPTEEDQERIESMGGEEAALEALEEALADMGGVQFNYDWVYSGDVQLEPGVLDEDESLISLAPYLEDSLGVDFAGLNDEDKANSIRALLQRGRGNVEVKTALVEWGRATQEYLTPDEREKAALVAEGFSSHKAETLQAAAKQYDDVSAIDIGRIWKYREETMDTAAAVGGPQAASQYGVFQTARDLKEGLELYDQQKILAQVHTVDPSLAARLREDPYGLDGGELRRVLDIAGGENAPEGDPGVNWIRNRLAGGYKPSAAVDTESVEQAVKTLADAWNLTGAEAVAGQLASELTAQAVAEARAELPNPFAPIGDASVDVHDRIQDVAAHVRSRLRQTTQYQELFGEKPAGQSETDYVGRFESRSQRLLGDNNIESVRAGMRSGDPNTVYQQAFASGAGEDSTRFQEITARNAEIFREML